LLSKLLLSLTIAHDECGLASLFRLHFTPLHLVKRPIIAY